MKRSMVALLLLIALSLSGCKGQKAASSANPVERFEPDVKQETSTVVPNPSVDEESQPIEQQKPAEEEKPTEPAEEQKPAEEEKPTEPVKEQKPEEEQKPAEEQKSEEPPAEEQKDDPEIVKFWETVPEMSVDEAKTIVKAKFERIKSEEKLGTLTDEERMAFYVLNCNYYDALHKKDELSKEIFPRRTDQVLYEIQIDSAFDGDAEEYFRKYSWEKEPFAEEHLNERNTTLYCMEAGEGKRIKVGSGFVYMDIFDMGYTLDDQVRVFHSKDTINLMIYRTDPQLVGDSEPVTELYRNILKHYLSLKPVAFLEGPRYFDECKLW